MGAFARVNSTLTLRGREKGLMQSLVRRQKKLGATRGLNGSRSLNLRVNETR